MLNKNVTKWMQLVLAVVLALAVTACGSGSGSSSNNNNENTSSNSNTSNTNSESNSKPEQNAERFVLRVAHNYPEQHVIHKAGYLTLKQEAETRSNGRLQIDIYPAEQLGSSFDLPQLVKDRVVDIGEIFPNYYPDKLPVGMALSLPGMIKDEWTNFYGLWEVVHEGPIAEEWKRNNLVPILITASPFTEFVTKDVEIDSLEKLKGLKIRSTGGAMDFIRNAGITPIKLPLGEIFTAIDRGTINGAVMNYSLVNGFGLWDQFKFATDGLNAFALGTVAASMDKDNFDRLPKDLQQVLYESGKTASLKLAEDFFASNEAAKKDAIEKGVKFTEVSSEFKAEFVGKLTGAYDEYVKVIDSIGLNGQETLDAIRVQMDNAAKVSDQKKLRDFDITTK